ncbi:SDR family oxidoreductase [Phenylobacterium montanum]|uniref:SDR family NAD(P)-dependent oxidoreductase n=1 Tax=Phenylobacterium montanum TaxID=2823693 RepID=A0A975IX28_9CAUL|nr:SDR family NAD(P)-dependent oxidoreductase [Caulobacter sp. S6]QUD90194.1 SDR family NAD(P)-dependent oxidoreductase [Caulobacter sp. S6]
MHNHPIKPGRVALVTGGASGIGFGIAQVLMEAGLQVIVTDVRADHMERAQQALGTMAGRATFVPLDVSDRGQWGAARRLVEERFGDLHVLCLNAGVGVLGSMLESSDADWNWIMSVNLDGALLGVETFLPHLLAHGQPAHIVATSSMGGLVVANDGGIYSTAKFGVVALMEGLRRDLRGQNVSVSILCPAAVNTNIFDHERMRPATFGKNAQDEDELERMEAFAKTVLAQGRDPLEVGKMVKAGIEADETYIFTDQNVMQTLVRRRDALLAFT